MSSYEHSVCDECWKKRSNGRTPHRLVNPKKETCCFCGKEHQSGIGVLENPLKTLCGGKHAADAR
jgi:hypothetical protein